MTPPILPHPSPFSCIFCFSFLFRPPAPSPPPPRLTSSVHSLRDIRLTFPSSSRRSPLPRLIYFIFYSAAPFSCWTHILLLPHDPFGFFPPNFKPPLPFLSLHFHTSSRGSELAQRCGSALFHMSEGGGVGWWWGLIVCILSHSNKLESSFQIPFQLLCFFHFSSPFHFSFLLSSSSYPYISLFSFPSSTPALGLPSFDAGWFVSRLDPSVLCQVERHTEWPPKCPTVTL